MTEELQRLRDRLLSAAFLFDDPAAYRAGVEDALAGILDQQAARPAA